MLDLSSRFHINSWLMRLLLAASALSLHTAAFSSDRGASLYTENCAICHGDDGMGGMGVPLALKSFLDSASTEYLRRTIRMGRPGRIMPSFYWMSDEDIDAIIQFMSGWRTTPPPVWSNIHFQGDAKAGGALFQAHCASCHGKQAEGGKGSGMRFSRPRDLPITAPSLSNQGFLNSVPDQMLQHVIVHGRDGTPMPDASSMGLTKHDVYNLVTYIRSLQADQLSHKPLYHSEPPSIIVESPYSFDETVDNLKRAISGSNFVHIRDQELLEGFDIRPLEGTRQKIIYFCSFSFLYEALKIDPRVGMFLPCRITVTEASGKVQMMSINPRHLSQLFNNSDLDKSCDQMYELYSGILEDASL